ncbi:uncharacterized protein LOC107176616 [Citrus sinensis]|uniref:uncharacterized protein LOC107176616 n=1 Tax=Citrus sinensis TaxID=2711 RepID=UPI000763B651|nr:uncharacterized protein LOC107176616 [Citrus sinensis]
MSSISWNYRGLGHPRKVQVLMDLVRNKKPDFLFLMETLCSREKLESLKLNLGYVNLFTVNKVGRSGGLALNLKLAYKVQLLNFGRTFIDVQVENAEVGKWRYTGFYGFPEMSRRRDSWELLRSLSSVSSLPWIYIGDFNDLLHISEKWGRCEHPNWKLNGFRAAVSDFGLVDLSIDDYQYTWESFRGTIDWVEECLDRALAFSALISLFPRARLLSLEAMCSDHLPIFLDPFPQTHYPRIKRFRFENVWLREQDCVEVITKS